MRATRVCAANVSDRRRRIIDVEDRRTVHDLGHDGEVALHKWTCSSESGRRSARAPRAPLSAPAQQPTLVRRPHNLIEPHPTSARKSIGGAGPSEKRTTHLESRALRLPLCDVHARRKLELVLHDELKVPDLLRNVDLEGRRRGLGGSRGVDIHWGLRGRHGCTSQLKWPVRECCACEWAPECCCRRGEASGSLGKAASEVRSGEEAKGEASQGRL